MPNGNKSRKGKTTRRQTGRSPRNSARAQARANRGTPAAFATTAKAARGPRFRPGNRCTTITHTELIADVELSGSFAATSYTINPASSATFPWLSTQALGWEYYRFSRIAFRYEPYVGTTTHGQIALAIEYSAGSDAPQTMSAMLAYEGAVSGPAYRNLVCNFNPTAGHPAGKKYVRHSSQAPTERKLYDAGEIYVARMNATGVAGAGVLRVTYTVTFYTPQVQHLAPVPEHILALGAETPRSIFFTGTETSDAASVIFDKSVVDSKDIQQTSMSDGGTRFKLPAGIWKAIAKIPYTSTLSTASAATEQIVAELMNAASTTFSSLTSLDPPVYGKVKRINIPTTGTSRTYDVGFDNILNLSEPTYVTVALEHALNTARVNGNGSELVGRNIWFERIE